MIKEVSAKCVFEAPKVVVEAVEVPKVMEVMHEALVGNYFPSNLRGSAGGWKKVSVDRVLEVPIFGGAKSYGSH